MSCGNEDRMKTTLQSFLAHFTYPLKEIVIAHCTDIKFDAILPKDHDIYAKKLRVVKGDGMTSMVQMLTQVIEHFNTPYIYLSDSQWKTNKG